MPRISDPSFDWAKFLGPEDSRYVVFELEVEGPKANNRVSSEVIGDQIPLFQCKWIYYSSDECYDIVYAFIPIKREFEFRELLDAKSPELIPESVDITILHVDYKDYKQMMAKNAVFYNELVAESKKKVTLDTALASLSTQSHDTGSTQRGWLISMTSDHYKPNYLTNPSLTTVYTDPDTIINHFNLLHYCTLNDHHCLATETDWSVSNVTVNSNQLQNMKPGDNMRVFELEYGKKGARQKVLCSVVCLIMH